ncbi:MAG: apolipoprotein acyltransferase [Rhodobacteraceae bacterium]|nr:apolipoprotein acyltransferase [Paracoccaceae bacterium]
MIVLIIALIGAGLGAATAKRRKGNRLDIAQYAAVYGIAFTILGLIVTIAIEKLVF